MSLSIPLLGSRNFESQVDSRVGYENQKQPFDSHMCAVHSSIVFNLYRNSEETKGDSENFPEITPSTGKQSWKFPMSLGLRWWTYISIKRISSSRMLIHINVSYGVVSSWDVWVGKLTLILAQCTPERPIVWLHWWQISNYLCGVCRMLN